MEDEADARERLFHNAVREILIHFLFFVVLYVFAYVLISKFKKKKDDYFADDDEDAVVYRISAVERNLSLLQRLHLHPAAVCLPVHGVGGTPRISEALWRGYLPFLYSCLSCFGVMLLLMCTPVGFARLFTVLGELVMKPKFLRDIQEEYQCTLMEEENLGRRTRVSSHELEIRDAAYSNGTNGCVDCAVQRRLAQLERRRKELALQQLASPWRRNLGYPIAMLALLSLTVISLLMVIHNTLQLLIGIKALPVSSQVEQFSLGISSLSALGVVGSLLEIVLILYLWLASVVGFFSLPIFCLLRPKPLSATLTQVIGNCAVLLLLSSALPVLARTLGITNFDLLGDFGRIEWLASFPLVLTYNLVFVAAAAASLVTKVTAAMRTELLGRLAAWKPLSQRAKDD
ncbi:LMBR1-like protein lilipod isoform X7 [Amblyomma americanum]